ncbi:unnamed protein product [Caenorhabditis angaria]|uniref:Uncharacterized protein n=1 Tax=Caenorhabditis angaria TaxID=860376 RepID=A0A9P1IUV5_9PELO|nr:unnamed protein product [Caenorhabditis angaria]
MQTIRFNKQAVFGICIVSSFLVFSVFWYYGGSDSGEIGVANRNEIVKARFGHGYQLNAKDVVASEEVLKKIEPVNISPPLNIQPEPTDQDLIGKRHYQE